MPDRLDESIDFSRSPHARSLQSNVQVAPPPPETNDQRSRQFAAMALFAGATLDDGVR
jgi:hypothetical protein